VESEFVANRKGRLVYQIEGPKQMKAIAAKVNGCGTRKKLIFSFV
jgi:hypothetical protein